jgi:putative transcriptional regulator
MTTKTGRIVKARLGADGRLRRVGAAGKPGRVMAGRVDAFRIDGPAAFAPDADTPVLTRRQLRELKPVHVEIAPDVAALRRRLRVSQGVFAALFGIPLATVKDWEQGRRIPDAPSRAYLCVIEQNPNAVRNALKTAAE